LGDAEGVLGGAYMEQMSSLSSQVSIETSGATSIDLVERICSATSARQPWFIKNNSKTNKIGIQIQTDKNTKEDPYL